MERHAPSNKALSSFFLNEIGKWYLAEVSLKDEYGNRVEKLRGLYCTNCHNYLAQELYRTDDLRRPVLQEGKTLRNKSSPEIIAAIAGGDSSKFRSYFADPTVGAEGEPLYNYVANHKNAVLCKSEKADGELRLLPWNGDMGEPVSYSSVSGGSDWWLSPAEPHCADCHIAPFTESGEGSYFPIDQPGKYSLFRYSKAHGVLACQSCHQSMHGLYPVRVDTKEKTVDWTTHEQALQFSPDGKYTGPLTCAACHMVNEKGVPNHLQGTAYCDDYWASVVLIHFMRDGDQDTPISELVQRYPYTKSSDTVRQGWSDFLIGTEN